MDKLLDEITPRQAWGLNNSDTITDFERNLIWTLQKSEMNSKERYSKEKKIKNELDLLEQDVRSMMEDNKI